MLNILRQKRKDAGLTQAQTAEYIGVNMHTYQKLEKGSRKNVPLVRAKKLAALFNTTVEDLFPDEHGTAV